MFNNEMDEMAAEFFFQGDARRCPRHPQVKMSSDDGMYDAACCDLCEGEMADAEEAERFAALSPEERDALQAEQERRVAEDAAAKAAERASWGDELSF